MERKLSDKERCIIQGAVKRSAENHFDRQKGWKRVKRCTNNGYIIRRRHSWLAICVSALCLLSGSGYLFIRHFAVYPPAISPSPEIYKADGIPVLTLENGEQIFLNPNQSPLVLSLIHISGDYSSVPKGVYSTPAYSWSACFSFYFCPYLLF